MAPEMSLDLGRGTLVIGDVEYLPETDAEAAGFGLTLRRLDGAGGPYHVGRAPGRAWRCDCPAYRYRRGACAPYGCKHTQAARGLAGLMEKLDNPMSKTAKKKPEEVTTSPPAAPVPPPGPPDETRNTKHETPERIAAALAVPFPAEAIGWKPQTIVNSNNGSRALALAYIDARDVMDRLDAVLGIAGWQDSYHENADGTVCCTLELRLGGEWLSRCDVGGESEQKDAGDRKKAAYSDALKRAAVKFGIGRYLYSLPAVWADYDVQKRAFVRTPSLPAWALPVGHAAAELPGVEFLRKVHVYDEQRGYGGALIKALQEMGRRLGAPADMTLWGSEHVEAAREETRRFEAARKAS